MRVCAAVLVFAATGLAYVTGSWAQDDESPVQDAPQVPNFSAEIEADLKTLSAPEFKVREAASQRFLARKLDAVEPLFYLALNGTAEASVRAFDLLRQLNRDGDDATIRATEMAFEALSESENPTIAMRAEGAMEANAPVRRSKAIAAFLKLGGIMRYFSDDGEVTDTPSNAIALVTLHPDVWKGGDEGIRILRRIDDFRGRADRRAIAVFVIKGSISKNAVEELRTFPNTVVQERGKAQLGVTPNSFVAREDGMQIQEVKPGSAAARAGLISGDVIVKFGAHRITSFEGLVEKIGDCEPGEQIPVVYVRNFTEMTATVELQGWEGIGTPRKAPPTPPPSPQ
ncbi:MAG: PDZ domain-containing protein [Planctomycetes bacterium]|nr:PDZ domain-containing protein [Planctomycetota bacterium]